MRQVILIGTNFVRTQWLTLLIMSLYLIGIATVFAHNQEMQEARFFLKMHSFYLVAIAMLVAAPAVHAERRSRRILAVLSKGIHRWQYLGGILCGSAIISAIFCLLVTAIGLILCVRGGYPTTGLIGLMAALFACCLMASAIGLFYSTFLHPFLATTAATLTLALPYVTERAGWHVPSALFPASWMAESVINFQFGTKTNVGWICASALMFAILFWLGGAAMFARRDVTTSPE
jgi:ABC-type transport system involved in multi-copper enzyme maturation permease subunit